MANIVKELNLIVKYFEFPPANVFKLCFLAKRVKANFLKGKPHRVVQTVSRISQKIATLLSKKVCER